MTVQCAYRTVLKCFMIARAGLLAHEAAPPFCFQHLCRNLALAGTGLTACHLCRGTVHSLRPREIAFVLPGSEYKEADLQRIHLLAESKASDVEIMQDAWEV